MLRYEAFYRKAGTRRPGQLSNPLILDAFELNYPINTSLYYFKVTDAVEQFNSNIPLLNNIKQGFVKTIFFYNPDITLEGNFIQKPVQVTPRLKQIKGTDDKFLYLKPNIQRTITRNTVLIYNYGSVGSSYNYRTKTAFTNLHKFNNLFRTVMTDVVREDKIRNKFIIIDLPDALPKLNKIDIFCKKLNITRLKSIPSYKYFTFFELWKFITPELKENSIFNQIPITDYEYVTLLLTISNKVVVFNLAVLLNMVDEFKKEYIEATNKLPSTENIDINIDVQAIMEHMVPNDIKELIVSNEEMNLSIAKAGYKAKLFRKLFYLFINRIILNTKPDNEVSAKEVSVKEGLTELENDKDDIVENAKEHQTEAKIERNIDKIIEEELPVYNTKDDNDDHIFGEKEEVLEDESGEGVSEFEEEVNIESKLIIDTSTTNNLYTNLDSIKNEKPIDPDVMLDSNLNTLKEYGAISRDQEKKIRQTLQKQKTMEDPYKLGKLESIIKHVEPNEKKIDNPEVSDNKVVFDKSFNRDTINNFDKSYIKKSLKKDTIRSVYALQNYNTIIEDYQIETKNTILEHTEEHIVKVKSLSGNSSTIRFQIPVIEEDGTFKMSGNSYRLRKQRRESPIRKIDYDTVQLTSYYGKIKITKANRASQNFGRWLSKQLLKQYEANELEDFLIGKYIIESVELPLLYTQLARNVLLFRKRVVDDVTKKVNTYYFNFNYKERDKIVEGIELSKIEKDGGVVCGKIDNTDLILMYKGNILKKYNLSSKLYHPLYPMDKILGIDFNTGAVEFSSVKVNGNLYPSGLLLSYYIGLDNLLRVLKVKYEAKVGTNIKSTSNQYKIRFKDVTLVVDRDYGLGDMTLFGLTYLTDLRDIDYKLLSEKGSYNIVFSYLNIPERDITEIKILETMFVDPLTLNLLRELNEPETFKGLLIKANELLLTDYTNNKNNIEEQCIKGYERLNGMIFNVLLKGLKDHEHRANLSKSRIEVDKYAIMKLLKDDSSVVLVEDLNPLAMMKQTEDVTYLGMFGRDGNAMRPKSTRVFHHSEVGVISEGVKDSGDVGVTAYLVPDPKISSLTGKIETDDKLEWGNILNTSSLLSPFSTMDDSKRFK